MKFVRGLVFSVLVGFMLALITFVYVRPAGCCEFGRTPKIGLPLAYLFDKQAEYPQICATVGCALGGMKKSFISEINHNFKLELQSDYVFYIIPFVIDVVIWSLVPISTIQLMKFLKKRH